jgi:hypothetical protein
MSPSKGPALSRQDVRQIARRMPRALKAVRGRMMLEGAPEMPCTEDVSCPACDGTGWLVLSSLEHCPVCCGFREVPELVADWFKCQARRALEAQGGGPPVRDAGQGRADEPAAPSRGREGTPGGERLGRLAEVTYRVHLPEDASAAE